MGAGGGPVNGEATKLNVPLIRRVVVLCSNMVRLPPSALKGVGFVMELVGLYTPVILIRSNT
jgi:hypothetical protein